MADPSEVTYPRPDFVRAGSNWISLNGVWDFLFDDEDIGLASRWHRTGLPDEVSINGSLWSSSETRLDCESESITAKIAANPQNLVKGNLSQTDRGAATHQKRKINVPFVFQAPASGINERGVHEVLWYERVIEDLRADEEKEKGHHLLVRFGAVDYEAKVWVNGEYVGGHRGGHVPFDIDITDAVNAYDRREHRLTLRVYDSAYDLTQPRGKQYWGAKPESIFYTPSGGIWQNVWMESAPTARIAGSSHGTILRNNDINGGSLHAKIAVLGRRVGWKYSMEIEASFEGVAVNKSKRKDLSKETDYVNIDLDLRLSKEQRTSIPTKNLLAEIDDKQAWRNGLALWSPQIPQLYDISIRLFDSAGSLVDEIQTTTGMRALSWTSGKGTFLLNNQPLFQVLCLDQGYWPSTFLTPPSTGHLKADIELAKNMGFNGCRKHQKVEDPVFLYWADRLGYLVWGEMGNAYSFSDEYVERFNEEWMEAVKRDINHPCIVTWTPVNESWAYNNLKNNVEQRNHIRSLYYMTKTFDPTRPINDNCGWEHVKTDLTTFHDYADSQELAKTCSTISGILSSKAGRPVFTESISNLDPGASHTDGTVIICTEFGGVNIAPAAGEEQGDGWGYTTAADPDDLLHRVRNLVNAVVDGGHCAGFVYTQFSDIEQETNGLYSFERKPKLDVSKVKQVMEEAKQKYFKHLTAQRE